MRQSAGDAQIDEPGLFPPGDHGDGKPRGLIGPLDEFLGIMGVAHGGGRHGDDLLRAVGGAHGPERMQHMEGPLHGLFLQAALLEGVLAQAQHVLDAVEHRKDAVGSDAHHHEVGGIAAQIDDPQNPAYARARSLHCQRTSFSKTCRNSSALLSRRCSSAEQPRADFTFSTSVSPSRRASIFPTAPVWL